MALMREVHLHAARPRRGLCVAFVCRPERALDDQSLMRYGFDLDLDAEAVVRELAFTQMRGGRRRPRHFCCQSRINSCPERMWTRPWRSVVTHFARDSMQARQQR